MMPRTLPPFVAIDFETANRYPNSACSVALVRVERGRVADRLEHLIRPPFRTFEFTHIHHITWRHVQNAATFEEMWPSVRRALELLATAEHAHGAPSVSSVPGPGSENWGGRATVFGSPWNYGSRLSVDEVMRWVGEGIEG
jgi:hypothetical protein